MEHRHLDAATLERLLATDRTTEQSEQLFHLLAVCPRCREVGGWLLALYQANALPPVFGPIDAALARSRAEAPRLLEKLLPLAPEERLARLHADPRFVSWGLCDLLARRSCQTAAEKAFKAVHLADLEVMWRTGSRTVASSRRAGYTSFGASPGPLWETHAGCRATTPEPSGASTWRTPGGRRVSGATRMPWATSPSSWT